MYWKHCWQAVDDFTGVPRAPKFIIFTTQGMKCVDVYFSTKIKKSEASVELWHRLFSPGLGGNSQSRNGKRCCEIKQLLGQTLWNENNLRWTGCMKKIFHHDFSIYWLLSQFHGDTVCLLFLWVFPHLMFISKTDKSWITYQLVGNMHTPHEV